MKRRTHIVSCDKTRPTERPDGASDPSRRPQGAARREGRPEARKPNRQRSTADKVYVTPEYAKLG
jgi:hypothetical protein